MTPQRRNQYRAARFTRAYDDTASRLRSEDNSVHLAAIRQLAHLADIWPEHRQACVDVLCAHLRDSPPPVPPPSTHADATLAPNDTFARQVRLAVVTEIATRLRPGSSPSWQGVDLNLAGATLDFGDFSRCQFRSGLVDFTSSTFCADARPLSTLPAIAAGYWSGSPPTSDSRRRSSPARVASSVSFVDAQFSGAEVSFRNSHFCGAMVDFSRAHFSAGQIDFTGALFSDGIVAFTEARFDGARVSFSRIQADWPPQFIGTIFSSGTVSFEAARFGGEFALFPKTRFVGSTVSFAEASLLSDVVDFGSASFSEGYVDFSRANLDCELSFVSATFGGAEISFADAQCTGYIDFEGARFSEGRLGFGKAYFGVGRFNPDHTPTRNQIFLGGATFSGSFVDLSHAMPPSAVRQRIGGIDVSRPPNGLVLPSRVL